MEGQKYVGRLFS